MVIGLRFTEMYCWLVKYDSFAVLPMVKECGARSPLFPVLADAKVMTRTVDMDACCGAVGSPGRYIFSQLRT